MSKPKAPRREEGYEAPVIICRLPTPEEIAAQRLMYQRWLEQAGPCQYETPFPACK